MSQILVVDDDALVRDFLCRMLQLRGYSCDVAKNGADAIEKLGNKIPKLLITDNDMPVMDGMKLLEELARRPEFNAIPIILLTGQIQESVRQRAKELGVREVLGKPLDCSAIQSAVTAILA